MFKKQLETVREKYNVAKQASSVINAGIMGIIVILVILIYSEVENALPTPSNAELAGASTNATTVFSQAMELAPIIVLVLVASVILLVINRFR